MKKRTGSKFCIVLLILLFYSLPAYAAEMSDAWIADWDYTIKSDFDGSYICLNQYTGTDLNVTIYGKATVDGTAYPVRIGVTYQENAEKMYDTAINKSTGIINLSFESVDGVKVRSERSDRLDYMFYGMTDLETVSFGGNFDGRCSQAIAMFAGCNKLKAVDVETVDFGYASVYSSMFSGCSSLETVEIICPRGTNYSGMFYRCTGLKRVKVSGSDSYGGPGAMDIDYMFEDCTSLINVDMSGLNTSALNNVSSLFLNCGSLEEIDMSQFDFSKAISVQSMFEGCYSLKKIDLTPIAWNQNLYNVNNMFSGCIQLKEMTVAENFIIPENSKDFLKTSSPTQITIKGSLSQSFKDMICSRFESWNRYIGTVNLTAKTELTGKELAACEFAYTVTTPEGSFVTQNDAYGNIGVNACKIYKPGKVTFTIKEGLSPEDLGATSLIPRPLSDDSRYSCLNPERSKTVNIVLNPDGSLTAEDI